MSSSLISVITWACRSSLQSDLWLGRAMMSVLGVKACRHLSPVNEVSRIEAMLATTEWFEHEPNIHQISHRCHMHISHLRSVDCV